MRCDWCRAGTVPTYAVLYNEVFALPRDERSALLRRRVLAARAACLRHEDLVLRQLLTAVSAQPSLSRLAGFQADVAAQVQRAACVRLVRLKRMQLFFLRRLYRPGGNMCRRLERQLFASKDEAFFPGK